MCKTRHIQRRMSQRCIREKNIELVKQFGRRDGDKVFFNKKSCQDVVVSLKQLMQTVQKMAERGGMVLVETEQGLQITTYDLNSYRRKAA